VSDARLNVERILSGLALRRVAATTPRGPNLCIVDEATSTNDLAWKRLAEPNADGWVVFAEHQTQGRGRMGRRWESPRGASLLLSLLLVEPRPLPELGLIAGIACCDAIARATGVRAELKWPNDVFARGRKLGGILIESRTLNDPATPNVPARATAYVIGIGLNCLQHAGHFPPDLRERSTSLDLVHSEPVDRNAVAGLLLAEFDRWAADPGVRAPERVRRAWLDRSAPLGRRIELLHAGRRYTGCVVDLDPVAGLVVQLDEGERRLFDAAQTTVLAG